MEKLIVKGGNRLVGAVKTSGAKNAVLPIIAASILGTTPSHLDEVPMLEDVHTISEVLKCLGLAVECSPEKNVLDIDSTEITSYEAPYELVRTMRASFLVMGPLLARIGKARISMPGGCAIGARPIDIHLKGFEALGVKIEQGHGYIEASAPEGLKGTSIYFDFPSVGATENIMMDAVKLGGNRQELHERIRELSMEAGKTVKVEGKDNNLLELIAAAPAFNLSLGDLKKSMDPAKYVGRSKEQVESFLTKVIAPVLEENKAMLGVKAEINV